MSSIKIKYCIDNLNSAPFESGWDIEGGLSITQNDLTLTKIIDDPNDDGFRGDFVFFNLKGWLHSVPKLFFGERCEVELIDSQEIFLFAPKDDFTYFKYFIGGMGSVFDVGTGKSIRIEEINKRYPNHENGTPIKTEELVLEIIRVSELFIESLGPKIEDKSDVINFKQALDDAREAYELYLSRNTQN
ncbi:MAG TPA: hypothetical protein HA261_10240 [Methanosarcina sp.]|nr:hypothetical protein [Methanosarcina sp.]